MAAHTARDHTPDRQLVTFQYIARRVFGVLRQQDHVLAANAQALAHRIVIQQGNDNMAMGRF